MIIKLTMIALILATNQLAFAQNNTNASFSGIATLNPTCQLSADPINFGDVIGGGNSYIYQNATLRVLCSNSVPFNIGFTSLDIDSNEALPQLRQLKPSNPNNNDYLVYGLYVNSNYNRPLSNGTPLTRFSGTSNGTEITFTMYGRLLVQYATPDSYSDTVTATVNY